MMNILKSTFILLLGSLIASSSAFKLTGAGVDVEPLDNFDELLYNKEYAPYPSLVEEYRGQPSIMDDPTLDTRYRTWKRNADLINSLLALPKGMSDAGRR